MNKIFLVHLKMGIWVRKALFLPKNLLINTLISYILGIYAKIYTYIPNNPHQCTLFWVYEQISLSIYPIAIHQTHFSGYMNRFLHLYTQSQSSKYHLSVHLCTCEAGRHSKMGNGSVSSLLRAKVH